MLTKEDVMQNAQEYFLAEGFEIKLKETDLKVVKNNQTYHIISMGTVSDASSSSKKGKSFNKNQIRNLLGLALFEVSKVLTENDKMLFIFIVPDNKIYHKLIKEIQAGLDKQSIEVLVMSEVGQIK